MQQTWCIHLAWRGDDREQSMMDVRSQFNPQSARQSAGMQSRRRQVESGRTAGVPPAREIQATQSDCLGDTWCSLIFFVSPVISLVHNLHSSLIVFFLQTLLLSISQNFTALLGMY